MKNLNEYLKESLEINEAQGEKFPISSGAYNIGKLIFTYAKIKNPEDLSDDEWSNIDRLMADADWAANNPKPFAKFCKLCKEIKKKVNIDVLDGGFSDLEELTEEYDLYEIGIEEGDVVIIYRTDGDDSAAVIRLPKDKKKLAEEFVDSVEDTAGWNPVYFQA